MRSRSLIGEILEIETKTPAREDTYTRVRRAIDEALAELELVGRRDELTDRR